MKNFLFMILVLTLITPVSALNKSQEKKDETFYIPLKETQSLKDMSTEELRALHEQKKRRIEQLKLELNRLRTEYPAAAFVLDVYKSIFRKG